MVPHLLLCTQLALILSALCISQMSSNDSFSHPQVPAPLKLLQKPLPAAAPRHANYSQHMRQMQRGWASGLTKAIRQVDSSRLISVGNRRTIPPTPGLHVAHRLSSSLEERWSRGQASCSPPAAGRTKTSSTTTQCTCTLRRTSTRPRH